MVGIIFARLNVDAMLPTFDEVIESWRTRPRRPGERRVRLCDRGRTARGSARPRRDLGLVRRARSARDGRAGDRRAARRRLGTHRRVSVSELLPGVGRPAPFEVTRVRHPAVEAEPHASRLVARCRRAPRVRQLRLRRRDRPASRAGVRESARGRGRSPVRVLLTTGGHEIDLGDVPANVRVEQWVDEAGRARARRCGRRPRWGGRP